MKEIWKNIEGYDGNYQVSNFGNVKSLYKHNPIILKYSKDSRGYPRVCLSKKKAQKCCAIHRLVAEAFIPNPENKPQVNHKNGIKDNNRVENLEWCTNEENQKHAVEHGLKARMKGNTNPRARKINQYDLNGNFTKQWLSIYDITNELGIDRSLIWKCCIGKFKQSHGYIWRYANK